MHVKSMQWGVEKELLGGIKIKLQALKTFRSNTRKVHAVFSLTRELRRDGVNTQQLVRLVFELMMAINGLTRGIEDGVQVGMKALNASCSRVHQLELRGSVQRSIDAC